MKPFLILLKHDYLQRTRSYTFLITLCASIALAYTFVPEPSANYSTIRISDHIGKYNSAWFGYVTAIMTSVFLSLAGFYFVNNGIKNDVDTRVGKIIAATSISNFKYLLSKVVSNFLVLMTIVFLVFLMSIVLFYLYNAGFPFQPLQFIIPYLLLTISSMFLISVMAVIFEVVFGKYTVLQNIIFFFLFTSLMLFTPKSEIQYALDVIGNKIVIDDFERTVKAITNSTDKTNLTIGYVVGKVKIAKTFIFNGFKFPAYFIISRFLWMIIGVGAIAFTSCFFHRFNLKVVVGEKTAKKKLTTNSFQKGIKLSNLPKIETNFSIVPLLRTELLLLIRKGKKWLWILNIVGMICLVFLPLNISLQMILPVLWFLQVHRISELITKEKAFKIHYFTLSSFRPIRRILVAQIFSGFLLLTFLALPLLVRLVTVHDFNGLISLILGASFVIFLATTAGIISKGKKLFEVAFFFITYANINGITFFDYYGGISHNAIYLIKLIGVITVLASFTILLRISYLKK